MLSIEGVLLNCLLYILIVTNVYFIVNIACCTKFLASFSFGYRSRLSCPSTVRAVPVIFRLVTRVISVLAGDVGAGLYSVGLAEIQFAATKVRAGDLTFRGERG
jgi:hypothetical protein